MIKPIFVLGAARNGTTGLSNYIGKFNKVVCVHHPLHHGIHESNILKHKLYWGNFRDIDNYIRFLELYEAEDYFILSNAEKEFFYKNHQLSFYHFFLQLMDNYTIEQNNIYWLTKFDPLFYINKKERNLFFEILHNRYEEIKLIAIKRELASSVKSYLFMEGVNKNQRNILIFRPFLIILSIARYYQYYKKIDQLIKSQNGIFIKFEEFVKQDSDLNAKLGRYLGIKGSDKQDEFKYAPNTSFISNKNNRNISLPFKVICYSIYYIFKLFPFLPFYILLLFNKLKKRRMPIFHRIIKSRYFNDDLKNELLKRGSPLANNIQLIANKENEKN